MVEPMAQLSMLEANDDVIILAGEATGRQFTVVGCDKAGEKYLALLTKILDATNPATGSPFVHGIRTVVLNADGFPMDKDGGMHLGFSAFTTASIVINLSAHIEEAWEEVQKANNEMSLRGHIWYNLLVTGLHEMLHMSQWHDLVHAGKIDEALALAPDEKELDVLARNLLIEIAKTVDVEIPAMDDWSWFEGRIFDLEKAFAGGKEGWQATQSAMLGDGTSEDHTMWVSNTGPSKYASMYDYLLALSEDDPTTWPAEQRTIILNSAAVEPILATSAEDIAELAAKEAEKALVKAIVAKQNEFIDTVQTDCCAVMGKTYPEDSATDSEVAMFLGGRNTTIDDQLQAIEDAMRAQATGAPVVTELAGGAMAMTMPQDSATGAYDPAADEGEYYDPTLGMGYADGQGFDGSGFSHPSEASDPAAVENSAPLNAPPVLPVTLEAWQPDTAQVGPSLQRIYERLYIHMFEKCAWGLIPVQGGNAYGWATIGAIVEPVDISDIPYAIQLIIGMDTIDPRGGPITRIPLINGTSVKGMLSKGGLPTYVLYTNHGDGKARKRRLIAQNPLKRKNNDWSAWAKLAQQGNRYALLFDNDIPQNQGGGMLGSFQNGIWMKADF